MSLVYKQMNDEEKSSNEIVNENGSSSLEFGAANIRILKFKISMSSSVTILPLHPTGIVSVPESASLSIFCQADGNPMPTLRWLKSYKHITHLMSRIFNINITNLAPGSSILQLPSIKHEDSASYSCQATNKNGQVQKSVKLKVSRMTTPAPKTKSLCEQLPTYCVYGRCVSGLDSANSFMCLCSEDYTGARCDKKQQPKNQLKVKSLDNKLLNSNTCTSENCSWSANYIFFYVAFGFLVFILALLLIIFLLQRRRRNQLEHFAQISQNTAKIPRDTPVDASMHSKLQQVVQMSETLPSSCTGKAASSSSFAQSFCKQCETSFIQTRSNRNLYKNLQSSSERTYDPTYSSLLSKLSGVKSITSISPIDSHLIVHPCIYVNSPSAIPLYTIDQHDSNYIESLPALSSPVAAFSQPHCYFNQQITNQTFPNDDNNNSNNKNANSNKISFTTISNSPSSNDNQ